MYFLHLSLVGVLALLGLLDTSPTTQKPFRKFQRYLLERAQPYTPDVFSFLSQRVGSRSRDLEANEPASPFHPGTPMTMPTLYRTRKLPVCPNQPLFRKSRKPLRTLTPKEAYSMPPLTPSRTIPRKQQEWSEPVSQGTQEDPFAETRAALCPAALTVAVLVFAILKTPGADKKKRFIKKLAAECQPVGCVPIPVAEICHSPSIAVAPAEETSDGDVAQVEQEPYQKACGTQGLLPQNAWGTIEVQYAEGQLPVSISFELPEKIVPLDVNISIYGAEVEEVVAAQDQELPRARSASVAFVEAREDVQELQSNARFQHARVPTAERPLRWIDSAAASVSNWRERRERQERPRVAFEGWQQVNAHLGQATPERPPAQRLPLVQDGRV